jgi:hypothetical protein
LPHNATTKKLVQGRLSWRPLSSCREKCDGQHDKPSRDDKCSHRPSGYFNFILGGVRAHSPKFIAFLLNLIDDARPAKEFRSILYATAMIDCESKVIDIHFGPWRTIVNVVMPTAAARFGSFLGGQSPIEITSILGFVCS